MLQACLSAAELEPQLPIKGAIPAIRDKKSLDLRFEMQEMESFEIAWDEEWALGGSGEREVIDLLAWGDDNASDSHRSCTSPNDYG